MVKRIFNSVVEAGGPLVRQALEAIRWRRKVVASGSPMHEVKRLHLLEDSPHQAVIDFQL